MIISSEYIVLLQSPSGLYLSLHQSLLIAPHFIFSHYWHIQLPDHIMQAAELSAPRPGPTAASFCAPGPTQCGSLTFHPVYGPDQSAQLWIVWPQNIKRPTATCFIHSIGNSKCSSLYFSIWLNTAYLQPLDSWKIFWSVGFLKFPSIYFSYDGTCVSCITASRTRTAFCSSCLINVMFLSVRGEWDVLWNV